MGRDAYEDEPEDDRFSRPDFEPNALANALGSLNMLGDDVYLRMQATNVGLVDNFLNQLEAQVLREMVEQDGTPTSAFFVQAQTQMWIFALYELIRTWRGRSKQMVAWADNGILDKKVEEYRRPMSYKHHGREMFAISLDRLRTQPGLLQTLRDDLARTEQPFTLIEMLRMTLAKHEVAKVKGSIAYSPGYGRIDRFTGSIQYEISNDHAIFDTLTRRQIADMFRAIPKLEVPSEESRRSFRLFVESFKSNLNPFPFEEEAPISS